MNRVELASEIASMLMDEKYPDDAWLETDKDGTFLMTNELFESEFNNFYDEAYSLIKSCENNGC